MGPAGVGPVAMGPGENSRIRSAGRFWSKGIPSWPNWFFTVAWRILLKYDARHFTIP
jgi:hypothetical protein